MPRIPFRAPSLLPATAYALALLAGCAPSGDSASPNTTPDQDSDPGQAAFESIALPGAGTVGADPLALAQALYGSSEPVEGNYSEDAETLSATPDQQVVLFTQLGLLDDSVRGMRHRLEFTPDGDQWQLTWAGRQVTCWPGRGHEDWSTVPCT